MTDLAAICERCREAIGDGAGYLCVRYEDINRCQREQAEWEQVHPGDMHTGSELMTYPDGITWRAYHARCDPWPEKGAYQIDVEQVRSWRQLVSWTSHLMAKNWLADSDWDELLRELADDRGTRLVAVRVHAA